MNETINDNINHGIVVKKKRGTDSCSITTVNSEQRNKTEIHRKRNNICQLTILLLLLMGPFTAKSQIGSSDRPVRSSLLGKERVSRQLPTTDSKDTWNDGSAAFPGW